MCGSTKQLRWVQVNTQAAMVRGDPVIVLQSAASLHALPGPVTAQQRAASSATTPTSEGVFELLIRL